jgi:hypothetical protein
VSNYIRVLPRDLFNEAGLLKCLGRLWIILDETHGHKARFDTEDVESFDIVQDESSGAIFVRNIVFTVDGYAITLTRPLNARTSWGLYAETEDYSVAVFDDTDAEGNLSREMRELIGLGS